MNLGELSGPATGRWMEGTSGTGWCFAPGPTPWRGTGGVSRCTDYMQAQPGRLAGFWSIYATCSRDDQGRSRRGAMDGDRARWTLGSRSGLAARALAGRSTPFLDRTALYSSSTRTRGRGPLHLDVGRRQEERLARRPVRAVDQIAGCPGRARVLRSGQRRATRPAERLIVCRRTMLGARRCSARSRALRVAARAERRGPRRTGHPRRPGIHGRARR